MFEALVFRIHGLARWNSNTVRIMGFVEIFLSMMLLIPTLIAMTCGESWVDFFFMVPFLLGFGIFQTLMFKGEGRISPVMGILTMTLGWMLVFFVCSVPFYISGMPWYDALFEGVSGFTTTGASVIPDIESMPISIMFWRSFSQWIGGIAVVLVFMFLLPMMGVGGRAFLNNELSRSGTANFSMKMVGAAKSFIVIYVAFSVIELILLMICGVNHFEALCMMMSTISTGGLMVTNDSIAGYSFAVQAIVLIFMFLGGTNFFLHYRMICRKDYAAYLKSQEFIWTFVWFVMGAAIIMGAVLFMMPGMANTIGNAGANYWDALFTIVSIGTSTGYTVTDYSQWPFLAAVILWLAGTFGAMSGSTAGGIKIYRIMIVKSYIINGYNKMLHPNDVREVMLDGEPVDSDAVYATLVIMVSFLVVGLFSILAFMITEPGSSVLDTMGLTIMSLGNVGAGLGNFGPSASMVDLSVSTKLIMVFLMWVGRLEVYMALIVFTKGFWKEVMMNTKKTSNVISSGRKSLRDYARK